MNILSVNKAVHVLNIGFCECILYFLVLFSKNFTKKSSQKRAENVYLKKKTFSKNIKKKKKKLYPKSMEKCLVKKKILDFMVQKTIHI